jgi:hypothetical protein
LCGVESANALHRRPAFLLHPVSVLSGAFWHAELSLWRRLSPIDYRQSGGAPKRGAMVLDAM